MTLKVSLGNLLIFILMLDYSQPRFLIKPFLIKENECILGCELIPACYSSELPNKGAQDPILILICY